MIRVLQITDTHLYASPDGHLLGIRTLDALDAVLELIAAQAAHVDLVLATGDLVHDSSAQGYRTLRERLGALGLPVYCLPGNHDDRALMASVLEGGQVSLVDNLVLGDWVLVLLDSTIPGQTSGHLSAEQLRLLEERLSAHPTRHALVCLHHHPVPVGSLWMDRIGLDNAPELFAVIDRYPGVRGLVCGHIHQVLDAERKGVRLLGTPATCVQFTPGLDELRLDPAPPGYRWLTLYPDGRIETGVDRLPGPQPPIGPERR